jgi:hypothetical protein
MAISGRNGAMQTEIGQSVVRASRILRRTSQWLPGDAAKVCGPRRTERAGKDSILRISLSVWRKWSGTSGVTDVLEVTGICFCSRPEFSQPFTPEEAMELMKERWKAMNMISTGTVMMLAYAISWPQETLSCLK